MFEGSLIDIVLVHADPDGFWIDLNQLRQGILGAAGNGDGATNGNVHLGEFLAGEGAGGVS